MTALAGAAVLPMFYGVVSEGFSYADLATPRQDVFGFDGRRAAEPGFEVALLRALKPLDDTLALSWAQDLVALHGEEEVLRVRHAALREQPSNVKEVFQRALHTRAPVREAAAAPPTRPRAVRHVPDDEPYGP